MVGIVQETGITGRVGVEETVTGTMTRTEVRTEMWCATEIGVIKRSRGAHVRIVIGVVVECR